MTAQVIDLVSPERVDEAWEALCQHRKRLLEDGVNALRDRAWVEEDTRLDQRFRRLFMAMDGGK